MLRSSFSSSSVMCWMAVALFALLLPIVASSSSPVYSVSNLVSDDTGISANLDLVAGAGPYGDDIKALALSIRYQRTGRVRIRITDRTKSRWEVPGVVVDSGPFPPLPAAQRDYDVTVNQSPFAIVVRRKSDGAVIFDTTGTTFVYGDHYLEISTKTTQNPNIYGLGERVHNFRLDPSTKTYTMFNKDHGTAEDTNLYGTHPFYLEYRPPATHGVFLLNSNAMDVILAPGLITYKVIGGVMDFYIFSGGNSADAVVQEYTRLVGRPYMPPFWGLGWHQCRWGYSTLDVTKQVVANYTKFQVPLDTMWNDIDYMDHYKDFTFDPARFPVNQVRQFVYSLHNTHQHYVVIVDPGIKTQPGYGPYDRILQNKAFIADASGKPIINEVWPGETVFPDLTGPAGQQYWINEINQFYTSVPIDGLWIDMNEIVGFCDSQCGSLGPKQPGFDPNYPPYRPGKENLYVRTLNMTAQHALGMEYDVHDLFGYHEAQATHLGLVKARNKRPFVIGRSTYAGQGKWGYHWLGDNQSTFKSMFQSISGILSFSIFGVPLVGADICGFNGDTTAELCTRWHQLGSFYPFSRNHNSIGQISQEPWAFGQPMLDSTRFHLLNRYSLLPYLYTLFFYAHTTGSTVARPVFFEFPDDTSGVLPYVDRQFMLGNALFIAPVLDQGVTVVNTYLPKARWFNYWTGAEVGGAGTFVNLPAPLDTIPVLSRGGTIVPKQSPALTTYAVRQSPFQLLAALDANGAASGSLFVDDGDSLGTIEANQYVLITYAATTDANTKTTTLKNTVVINGFTPAGTLVLGEVRVYGVLSSTVCTVTVNGTALPATAFKFDASLKTLDITLTNISITQSLTLQFGCSH